MSDEQARWILAYDASCGACQATSHAVARACDGKLEVMPLAHPDVRGWRGAGAAWAPTLIKVGDDVQTWTGLGLVGALTRHLGIGTTMRVLASLGQRRRTRRTRPGQTGMAHRQPSGLTSLGVGLLAAVGSLMMTRPPADGGGSGDADAHDWVEANRDRLPQNYDEVTTHPVSYRKAILATLPADVRSQLWVEHLNRYRAARQDLTAEQADVIDRTIDLVPRFFAARQDHLDEARRLEEATRAAFGAEANAVVGRLGPATAEPLGKPFCICATDSDYCDNGECDEGGCIKVVDECGWMWTYHCDGLCKS